MNRVEGVGVPRERRGCRPVRIKLTRKHRLFLARGAHGDLHAARQGHGAGAARDVRLAICLRRCDAIGGTRLPGHGSCVHGCRGCRSRATRRWSRPASTGASAPGRSSVLPIRANLPRTRRRTPSRAPSPGIFETLGFLRRRVWTCGSVRSFPRKRNPVYEKTGSPLARGRAEFGNDCVLKPGHDRVASRCVPITGHSGAR